MTYTKTSITWEPLGSGIELVLKDPDTKAAGSYHMPMISVRELRDDMEEAAALSRGYELIEVMAEDLDHRDLVRVLGDDMKVKSVLRGREGVILDLTPDGWHDGVFEIVLPLDFQVTAYRSVAGD